MKIFYSSDGIDINRIECNSNEINLAIESIKENYPCVPRMTLSILDKNKQVYVYYFGFSGKRAVTTKEITNIDDIYSFVCENGMSSFESMIKRLKCLIKKL